MLLTIECVRNEEEEGHQEPDRVRDGVGGVERRSREVVIEKRRQEEVADAAEEPDEGQEVRGQPDGAKFDHPVPGNKAQQSLFELFRSKTS